MLSPAGANNFADLSSYLFIDSIFLLPGGRSGQQLWTRISCHGDVTSGKVQGSEPDMSATKQVILGYKCVHEGCQKSFESRKGYNFHQQRNRGKPCGETSSEAKPFRVAIIDVAHQDAHRLDLRKQKL